MSTGAVYSLFLLAGLNFGYKCSKSPLLNTQSFLQVEFVYRRISAQDGVCSLKKRDGDFMWDFSSCSETAEESGERMNDDEVPEQRSKVSGV